MIALRFAWRSLVRQPARALLGVLGVAAVGALLFDMLMLSDGLVVSMRDMLERTGFDIRITASGDLRRAGDRMHDTDATLAALRRLPQLGTVLAIRFVEAETDGPAGPMAMTLEGVQGDARPWTVLAGRDPAGDGEVVVSRALADALRLEPGGALTVRARCAASNQVLPPARLRVVGIAEFPFELVGDPTAGAAMPTLDAACASRTDEADIILASALGEVDATAAAVRAAQPRLNVATNEQVLGRLQRNGFTYFRQISAVLSAVTVGFALLLITVLLTVSVNQRLGEIAALRALGFSRRRVVADVLCESILIVGLGGLVSLPLGAALARGLDGILKTMPGIPGQMNFFVLEPATLGLHAGLLALTALAAALYPMQVVARLPIAATLRAEVLS
ncbi:MAG TPA: ABC transporter permease [Vicinamibacterales bacterium]|nr:ABC transporter permease [Vicinamibacterales bacterium]